MRSYLIVDDNRAMAENIAEIVRERGEDAVATASSEEALKLVGARAFDALLTDMRMPAMDGAQLIREARRADPGLPAILFTAFTHDEALRAVQEESPLAVLPKPVPLPTLLDLLAKARRHGVVAVLEDDAAFADNLSEALTREGFGVRVVRSVAEVAALGGPRPFAALVDLRLPGTADGAGMRALAARFAGLPLIVVSAHEDVETPLEPHRRFVKPFDMRALVAVLDALHRQSRESPARP